MKPGQERRKSWPCQDSARQRLQGPCGPPAVAAAIQDRSGTLPLQITSAVPPGKAQAAPRLHPPFRGGGGVGGDRLTWLCHFRLCFLSQTLNLAKPQFFHLNTGAHPQASSEVILPPQPSQHPAAASPEPWGHRTCVIGAVCRCRH